MEAEELPKVPNSSLVTGTEIADFQESSCAHDRPRMKSIPDSNSLFDVVRIQIIINS
jgi:hypothetical protein